MRALGTAGGICKALSECVKGSKVGDTQPDEV